MSVQNLSAKLSPDEQYKILSSGTVDLISKEDFKKKLKLGRPLRVKAGFDPSQPDLHLGHSILIHKLRQFQDLGHEVHFIVGDFTACIGDPSGQNKTRPSLSYSSAKKNAETYIKQATKAGFKLKKNLSEEEQQVLSFLERLDPKKIKQHYNSKWLSKLSLKDFILQVCSKYTIARQLERNDFSARYKAQQPIGLHEFLYPVLQAYDSVEIKADVEIGGTDQLFNLLLGRELQEQNDQSPQVVLTLELLEGIDSKQSVENWNLPEGGRKMSKSLNNAIAFNDKPKDIYGKTMKISDGLLIRYWNLFTEGKRDLKDSFKSKKLHPKKEKEKLAWLFVCAFYGEDQADKAQEEFNRVFAHKGLPDEIYENQDLLLGKKKREIGVCDLLKDLDLSSSKSEARRAILSGAVKKENKEKLTDPDEKITLKEGDEFLMSFGRRKFKRVNLKWERIHDLKAYLVHRRIKEGSKKEEPFKRVNLNWKWIHDLKVYLVHRRIKEEPEKEEQLFKELSEDSYFKDYISLKSIKMKIRNYEHLDTRHLDVKKGLPHYSKQSEKIFNEYEKKSIEEIEKDIKELEKQKGK